MRFAFIDVEKTSYPMRILCRVLKVSLSGYYARADRANTLRFGSTSESLRDVKHRRDPGPPVAGLRG